MVAEGQFGGDDDRGALVESGDEVEQQPASFVSASIAMENQAAMAFALLELRIVFPMVPFSLFGLQRAKSIGSRKATPTSNFQHRAGRSLEAFIG